MNGDPSPCPSLPLPPPKIIIPCGKLGNISKITNTDVNQALNTIITALTAGLPYYVDKDGAQSYLQNAIDMDHKGILNLGKTGDENRLISYLEAVHGVV